MLFPSSLPPLPFLSRLPCLACLFVCLCRAECAAAAAAEHALLAALANCCLLSSNAREGVYVCVPVYVCMCVCLCVCAGVLTLYKLLIIMSPSACRHDLHESFSLACHFMLSPAKGSSRYSKYISYIYVLCVCEYPWQLASGAVRLRALVMCRMSSSSTLFPLFYRRLRCCWR